MGLLIFSYIMSFFLFIYSYYLDARTEKSNTYLTGLAMASAFVSLFAGLSTHLLFTDHVMVSLLMFRLCMISSAFVSVSLLKIAFSIPYMSTSRFLDVLGWILAIFSIYLSFTGVQSFLWDTSTGFQISGMTVFGFIDGLVLFVLVYFILFPALSFCVLALRGIALKSRIYRQRVLLVAVSVAFGFAVSYTIFRLSSDYSWLFPLTPFGLAVLIVLMYRSLSITTLYDRSLVSATLINFTLLSLLFSVFVALITVAIVTFVANWILAGFLIAGVAVLMLSLRVKLARRLRKYIRIGTDYESDLEAGLEALEYTSGGEQVMQKTAALLDEFVESSTVEIFVSDEKNRLHTIYSTLGSKNEIAADNKAIDFLLGHNESIVLKTQAITHHNYADIKPELLKIFDMGRADALMILREGYRCIGIILLGPKKRGSDYTDYDYTVLSRLYSNFFLVMYYLKNIANESVVLTVDREIEFSGQIITAIQENIDRIQHPMVDVDFITRSARKLGGDFIDFIKLAQDKYLFVMGDVSGKGLNASMSMVILKSVLRTFLTETGDFKKLIVKVNLFIKNNLPKGTFFAGVFGLMDFTTNTLYYINCGVPAMFLYTASYNNAIEIQGDGKVLGFVKDISKFLKVKKITLNPQDIILITTDGLVDSTNLRGERFGKDRVQRMLMDNRSYPAGRIAQFLCDNLAEFVSRELDDDITVLVLKYLAK